MLRTLLICGLVAGVLGGLAATGFGTFAGEPAVDQAIAYEEANAPPAPAGEEEAAPVSRNTQKGVGLLTASLVYGLSFGGLFSLVFAYVYGRVANASPARTALWLAAACFAVVYLVPFVKYPPNPPAVGDPETITERTMLYTTMVLISIFAAVAAVRLRRALIERYEAGVATFLAGLGYLAIVVVAGLALPGIHEIPDTFPATTLWRFREASVGMQAVMWTVIGLVFSVTAQRAMTGRPVWALSSGRRAPTAATGD